MVNDLGVDPSEWFGSEKKEPFDCPSTSLTHVYPASLSLFTHSQPSGFVAATVLSGNEISDTCSGFLSAIIPKDNGIKKRVTNATAVLIEY